MDQEKYYGYNNTDFWKIVFDVDCIYNSIDWNEYKRDMNAIIKGVVDMGSKNINVTVTDSNIGGSIITGSEHVYVNDTKQNPVEECIKKFDDALEELLNSVQLSEEQMESLNKQANIFKDYVKGSSPKKEFADSLLDSLKSAVNCVIQNADSIQKLVNAGTSIVNILFKC